MIPAGYVRLYHHKEKTAPLPDLLFRSYFDAEQMVLRRFRQWSTAQHFYYSNERVVWIDSDFHHRKEMIQHYEVVLQRQYHECLHH